MNGAVEEHFEIKDGRLNIVTNDIYTPVEKAMKLENGVMIDENGSTTNGTRLLAGQKDESSWRSNKINRFKNNQ
ncbi:MAG: hypothetical protein R2847_07725 [Bacteroidia bacterium]